MFDGVLLGGCTMHGGEFTVRRVQVATTVVAAVPTGQWQCTT